MPVPRPIPQFHLYGETPQETPFDFVSVETIEDRARRGGWRIEPHSHQNLDQILVLRVGSGSVMMDGAESAIGPRSVVVVPATSVHGFDFHEGAGGAVFSFTSDTLREQRDRAGSIYDRLTAIFTKPVLSFAEDDRFDRVWSIAERLKAEIETDGTAAQIAVRAWLALLVVEIIRRSAGAGANTGPVMRTDAVMERLRRLIEERFRTTRRVGDYADALAMTVDRLTEHTKRVAGVTPGHMVRNRVVLEAKRQLAFTDFTVGQIAFDLGFTDPAHFSRYFRRYTDLTPQQFREHQRRS
ncbi:helix-turn-helix domain-containing protein [Propylenella binzhouense]|nr:helix-turn-helix domain-containing protein [Propylenella binzhouense]